MAIVKVSFGFHIYISIVQIMLWNGQMVVCPGQEGLMLADLKRASVALALRSNAFVIAIRSRLLNLI